MSNHLIHETSPYLLQHAENPVRWYPWGEEAFQKAQDEQKPIFLSIGYSTCHWCHVMERESFEDEQVAAYLNDHYVCIKVDKEERPDIDAVYMNICAGLTGGGGWPLTIIMTPEKQPFYAGTYLPKHSMYGRTGLLELLDLVNQKWTYEREELVTSAGDIVSFFANQKQEGTQASPSKEPIRSAFEALHASFDSRYGGFGNAPRFPSPHNLMFLLRYHVLERDAQSLEMVTKTLKAMYRGGMYDHIGYGFSRYATDNQWLTPHFEKMLYDNALLAIIYTEAWQAAKDPLYERIARQTLRYVQREMTSTDGAFFSAQDADVDGEEGKYYTFSLQELKDVLGEEQGASFAQAFGATQQGNFEGKNILNLLDNPQYENFSMDDEDRKKLLEYRQKRYSLHKDDKVLTSWNAMMIAAYSKAHTAFSDDEYLEAALRAQQFILRNMTDHQGELHISWRNGIAKGRGLLDDYAYFCWACLELYNATADPVQLEHAIHYAERTIALFQDREAGGYFMNAEESGELPFRPKEVYDGAVPSGNAVFVYCLGRLSALTGESKWLDATGEQLQFFSPYLRRQPQAHSFALQALMLQVYPSGEAVVVLDKGGVEVTLQKMGQYFRPQLSVLMKTRENALHLSKIAPFTTDMLPASGDITVYLCGNQSCSAPFTGLDELIERTDTAHHI